MIGPKEINDWIQNIFNSLPPGLQNLPKDLQNHLRTAMTNTFNQLDLITREEFDTQTAVLMKTRAKLEQLEERLNELEARQVKIKPKTKSKADEKAPSDSDNH